jgi:biopolymer transport protein ExbD
MARRHQGFRQLVEADLDTLPLMNLFIVLIPMLLLSAVFVEVTAIDMHLPGGEPEAEQQEEEKDPVQVAVHISADEYVVDGNRVSRMVVPRDEHAPVRLAEVLAAIRAEHPDHRSVDIVSQPTTHYDEIIAVMDVAREVGLPQIGLTGATAEG